MLTLKLTLKAIRAQLPKLFYFCLQWFSVCLRVVYTIKSDFYEMSPLAKVKRQDVPDFGEAAFKSHDASVNVCHYSWDFFFFLFLTFCTRTKASILAALFSCSSKTPRDVISISTIGGS